jgi:hypothetical protein
VATPTAETLGVQGLPQMMNAEQYVVDNHLADVISQSFGTAEEAFGSPQSLLQLRHAFTSAQAAGVLGARLVGRRRHRQHVQGAGQEPAGDPVPVRRLARFGPARHGRRRHLPVHRPARRRRATRTYLAGQPTSRCAAGQAEVGWIGSGARLQPRLRRAELAVGPARRQHPDHHRARRAGRRAAGERHHGRAGLPLACRRTATAG